MNIGGGEAADQMVRMLLSGTEVVIRLSGSALKNLLALTLALARNHKKLSGKVNLGKMLRETRALRQFSAPGEKAEAVVRHRQGSGWLGEADRRDPAGDRTGSGQPDLPAYAVPGTGPAAGSTHPREGADEGAYQPRKGPAGAPEAPQDPHGTAGPADAHTGPPERPDGPTSGRSAKKRVSVGTRLARYKNQLLYPPRPRNYD